MTSTAAIPYATRIKITHNGIRYALIILDAAAAGQFKQRYPRQQAVAASLQPAFPAEIVAKFREIKYLHEGLDEMALAFLLEKYNAGTVLLKQQQGGELELIQTVFFLNGDQPMYRLTPCRDLQTVHGN